MPFLIAAEIEREQFSNVPLKPCVPPAATTQEESMKAALLKTFRKMHLNVRHKKKMIYS